ncbi:hypothetical protein [Pseudomonas sp. LP_7_YM]|nr:hypothetical protein [Pseudomonas sp. LP_7_YM]
MLKKTGHQARKKAGNISVCLYNFSAEDKQVALDDHRRLTIVFDP